MRAEGSKSARGERRGGGGDMSEKPELPDWSGLIAEATGDGSYVGVGDGAVPFPGSYWWHMRKIYRDDFKHWHELAKGKGLCGKEMTRGELCARTPDHAGNCKTQKAMDNERARHQKARANGTKKTVSGTPGNVGFDDYMTEGWRSKRRRNLGHGPDC
jgi:hypothetical protein